MEKEQIPQVRKQLAEVRRLMESASDGRKGKGEGHRSRACGAAGRAQAPPAGDGGGGRLLISGELEDVLPLEDAAALEKAKPITPSGRMKLDPQKIEARHDAQVRSDHERRAGRRDHSRRVARPERRHSAAQRRQVRVPAGDDEAVQRDQRVVEVLSRCPSSSQEPRHDGADHGQGEQNEDRGRGLPGSSTSRTRTTPAKPLARM